MLLRVLGAVLRAARRCTRVYWPWVLGVGSATATIKCVQCTHQSPWSWPPGLLLQTRPWGRRLSCRPPWCVLAGQRSCWPGLRGGHPNVMYDESGTARGWGARWLHAPARCCRARGWQGGPALSRRPCQACATAPAPCCRLGCCQRRFASGGFFKARERRSCGSCDAGRQGAPPVDHRAPHTSTRTCVYANGGAYITAGACVYTGARAASPARRPPLLPTPKHADQPT